MTDWTPWGLFFMVTVFGTLYWLLRPGARTPAHLTKARRWFLVGGIVTVAAYLTYVVYVVLV